MIDVYFKKNQVVKIGLFDKKKKYGSNSNKQRNDTPGQTQHIDNE